MRSELGHSGRRTASVAFHTLVLLGFGLLVALSGFVSYYAPIYETCKSLWDNLLLWVSSLGALIPLSVGGSVVVITIFTLIRHWRATQRLLRALARHQVAVPPRLTRLAREVGLAGQIDCVEDVTIGPFCYGFVNPRVCLPVELLDLLNDTELRAVLRHEVYHAQSRDPLKIWLCRALARGLYFLPLAGDLRDSYLTAKEIAADEIMPQADELPLASALVKMVAANGEPSAQPSVMAAAVGNTSVAGLISITRVPSNQTEERIRRLVDGQAVELRLPSLRNVALSALIVAAIFAASYTNLNAMSMMPVSQECATVSQGQGQEPRLTIGWPVVSLENYTTAAEPTGSEPAATDQPGCGLLRPSCEYDTSNIEH